MNVLNRILLVLTRSVMSPTMLLYIMANKALMKTGNYRASFAIFSPKSFSVVVFFSFVQQHFSFFLWLTYLVYSNWAEFYWAPRQVTTEDNFTTPVTRAAALGLAIRSHPCCHGQKIGLFCPGSAQGRYPGIAAAGRWARTPSPGRLGRSARPDSAPVPQLLCQSWSATRCTRSMCWANLCLPAKYLWMWPASRFIHRNQSSAANTSVRQTIEPLSYCGKEISTYQSRRAFIMPGTGHPWSRCTQLRCDRIPALLWHLFSSH